MTEDLESKHRIHFILGMLWLAVAAGVLFHWRTRPAAVEIEWETANELDIAGFLLYRSQSGVDDYALLDKNLIGSHGSTTAGARYRYVDSDVLPGETYHYMLAKIKTDASIDRYENDIRSYTVPDYSWMLPASIISAMLGAALLSARPRR